MNLGAIAASRQGDIKCPLCGTPVPQLTHVLQGHRGAIDVCWWCWNDFGPDRHGLNA
jgi:hypothetical protein